MNGIDKKKVNGEPSPDQVPVISLLDGSLAQDNAGEAETNSKVVQDQTPQDDANFSDEEYEGFTGNNPFERQTPNSLR